MKIPVVRELLLILGSFFMLSDKFDKAPVIMKAGNKSRGSNLSSLWAMKIFVARAQRI